jgi:hypothetical protein
VNEMKSSKFTASRSWIRKNSVALLKFCNFSYNWGKRPNPRCGASSIEMFVALALVTSVLSLSAPLIVRHGRMLIAHRHYRVALDELTNQLERLTALPAAEVPTAVEQITPSPFASARLHAPKLQARIDSVEIGQRVTLTIIWDEPQRPQAPVSLAAWIVAEPAPADNEPPGEEEP